MQAPIDAAGPGAAEAPDVGSRTSRGPWLAVVAMVVVGFVAYALLATTVDSPRVFSDELLYFDTAAALGEGDGLTARGQDYRYAPWYPALLVSAHWLTANRETAYELAKALNALLFALASVPLFLLARRLVGAWPGVAVAALSIAIPSSSYVSVTMTESLAFLVCSWALYAMVRAFERPTVLRQLAAMVSIALSVGVRTQFVVLFAAYVLGLFVVAVVVPSRRAHPRKAAAALWPTWAACGLGAGLAVVTLLAGSGTTNPIGVYSVLWRSYDPLDIGRWLVYHLANLELYLAVVPVAVAPIALASMFRRGRTGDECHAAYFALFVATNVVFLLLVAAFNSTEYAVESLHDRALFYVFPLWLLVLFLWLRDGVPRPVLAASAGAAIAVVLPLLLPFSEYAKDDARQQFNGVGTTLWTTLDEAFAGAGRAILMGFVVVLVLAAALAHSRARLLPMAVLTVFLLSSALNWNLASRVASTWTAVLPGEERFWLDTRVPAGRSVTALAAVEDCPDFAPRNGFYLTEFFNSSLRRVAHVGAPPDGLPAEDARVQPGGLVTLPSGQPLVTDYVLAQPGVRLEGRRIAEGTAARLALWEVKGAVRTLGIKSEDELAAVACGRPPS